MLTAESEERLQTEDRLCGYQHKKGAIIFSATSKDLRTGTPVKYKVVTSIEEREVNDFHEIINEVGEVERVKAKKVIKIEKHTWAFGVISGVQPAFDERGLHGDGYEITTSDGSKITVPRDAIITKEMFDHIKYKPTLLVMYQHDDPVMVVMYTWDSEYLPCPQVIRFVPELVHESFKTTIEKQQGYDVVDDKLTISVTDANKNIHTFGPMVCSLFQNSDCRGCVSKLLNFSDTGWNNTRNLAKQLTGRGTMYSDGNFIIRKYVARDLFIRFIEVETWAKDRGVKYLSPLLEAILEFQEEHNFGMPQYQLEKLVEVIKEQSKEEYAELKKEGNKTEIDEYKELKKQITASLKKLKAFEDVDVEEGEEVTVADE